MEVVVSVATSTLNFAIKTAAKGVAQEFGLLLGVQEELLFIKHEFEMMQAYLRDASTEQMESDVTTTWIQQVKELAMDLEDCLQEASVHLKEKGCVLAMSSVKKRNQIVRNIHSLKARTSDVINRKLRYNKINNRYGCHKYEEIDNKIIKRNLRYKLNEGKKDNGGHTYDESASTRSIANVQALLVGLDEPKKKLVELILKENGEVISVVGMGGIGKTTLVREVYGCQEVRDEFKHFAWVTIQHPFNTEEFIESLAKQIPSNPNDNKSELSPKKKLKEKVIEYLMNKKYLIVLDDLSSLSEWDKIKDVLPVASGRQIVVTTRYKSPLAETITHPSENIYEIKELSEKDAFDLFCKAVYKTSDYRLVSDEGPSSTEKTKEDSKMQEQSTKITFTKDMDTKAHLIIESCGRLPLAIITIGSYLATKPKTSAEWMKMHTQLSSELTNNPELGVVKPVLTSSYDGMPYHLKPCLLYLSVFHNHKEIRRSRIIKRWMADGYVMADRKKTAEEVGKGYFYDLMGRSLIQPSQMSTNINGDIKRCNIHDMMYELILAKAEDENMVSVLEDENLITMKDKVRHLVVTGGSCTGCKVQERVNFSHMRSLSIFGEVGDYLKYSRMKLVRVLDLEGTINLKDRDLRSIGKLHHLKYLGLRGTKIRKLPNSLGNLTELETLDIRNTKVDQLPTGLTKLQKLSYLRAGSVHCIGSITPLDVFGDYMDDTIGNWLEKLSDKCFPPVLECVEYLLIFCCIYPLIPCFKLEQILESRFSGGVRVPRGIGKLRSLNIFGVIDIGGSKSLAKELQNLTNLRKLAVGGFTKENGKILGKVIDGLKHLRSLVLKAADESGLRCCLDSVYSPPKYLRSLKLHSPLGELPKWISSLENLEKIHIRGTYLTEEINAIEKLPNLKILYLFGNTFKGYPELIFGDGTFPMLQVFILADGVKSVSIEKTALERLEQLKIRIYMSVREGGVLGLEFLEHLKEMEVLGYYDDESNREFVRNIEEQLKKLPKEPVFRVIKDY